MRRAILSSLTLAFFVAISTWSALAPAGETIDLKKLALNAVSEDPAVSQPATETLRTAGPEGFAAFQEVHRAAIDQHRSLGESKGDDPAWKRIATAMDQVAGQRDCYASRLYWYTDLEVAKAESKKTGKPILSLRLLGKLTDEFSCANSRFFRTTLYANEEVSQLLRDKFVLHWQSVRPVPKVTIDFGDGRKLERTLTGNSIHYVLDSDGRVIDALPGLYGPHAFIHGLETARAAAIAARDMSEADLAKYLVDFHSQLEQAIRHQWQNDLADLKLLPSDYDHSLEASPNNPPNTSRYSAVEANKFSSAKGQVETPILASALTDAKILTAKTDDDVWGRIAQLHRADAQLDDASVALIRSQHPTALAAAPLTYSKAMVENPLVRIVRNLQNTIAIDTVRNEYTLHRRLHEWLSQPGNSLYTNLNDLNEQVYAQLFLTPSSDPWLGLAPDDAYSALDHNGVSQN